MLARAGTVEGWKVWPWPCRARKATRVPEGREQIAIGELGKPQGWTGQLFSLDEIREDVFVLFLGLHVY